MWSLKALRLLSTLGLSLSLLGPVSGYTPASIASASQDESLLQPSQPLQSSTPQTPPIEHVIHLKSGDVTPGASDLAALKQLARSDGGRLHVLLQLDFIPRDLAKSEYEKNGLKLLAYVPDYAWIASIPAADPAAVLNLPGVTWAGPLTVNDKLDPSISSDEWLPTNLAPDGTVAVSVITYLDEDAATTRALVEKYGGKVTGEAIGIKLLMVEMPRHNVRALAAAESVQWIEQAAPPLGPTNDGIRQQLGVNTLQAAPYNLNGTNIDVLVYDSGQVGNHIDFTGRLTHGDADTVSEHSTHVAGTVGGSGANSVAQGGGANQWRGMAPNVDLISYGTQYSGVGPIFYQNVPDIESDFATAQNIYGADLGTASVGSNVYSNYPLSCTQLMGKYGASAVLIDQIVRGGNSQVGVGDKYITTWAAGNERNNTGSCSDTYNSIAPPGAAKNPIHVGASNTNNNTMTSFSSWGPTGDGRIKPIVVAGGCQSSGDFGIKSTDNSPTNTYTLMCGTSMATPAVAGGIALMLQHYRSVYGTSGNFWPSTAKAILMQTADDFGNPGPDYQWGFGQVDLLAAVNLISRTAFLQDNVAHGSIDVFYFQVKSSATPAQVSLAWDDWEATLNASPALINNLDLELVSPNGTLWRPWILNPASPANNATRGINTRDNQEQVTVPTPEIGTWIVRVKGTTVPHGPQDYALACEGCQALNVGVCQFKVSGATPPSYQMSTPAPLIREDGTNIQLETPIVTAESAGERWQRGLEDNPIDPRATQADLETWARIEAAHAQGPAAVLALRDQLTGRALELAQAEIEDAEAQLNRSGLPPIAPAAPDAVNRVGINGSCAYPTLQQAVNAATTGDTVRVAAGVYFENVDINSSKVITIEGGYDSTCTTPGAGVSKVDGSTATESTWDITAGTIVLRNLEVTWGATIGSGIDVDGSAQVTLDNTDVFANHGTYGGGVYVGPSAALTTTNGSQIHDNTASLHGGGARIWGEFSGYSNDSDIYNNCGPHGGGFSVPGGHLALNAADVYGNRAVDPAGKGGGIHVYDSGAVTLTNNVFVYFGNTAYDGAGIYADNASLNFASVTFRDNTAANYGGGLYLTNNSFLRATGSSVGQSAAGLYNDALRGGGIYAITSTLDFAGSIINNRAAYAGAGLYASNSTVNLTNATVGGTGANLPNLLGANGHEGVGLFLTDNTQATLSNTVVSSNTFQSNFYTYGGGALVDAGSTLTLTNSRIEQHLAPDTADGRGAGLYVRNATVTLDNSQIISNTAGTVGGGVRLYGGILNVMNGSALVNNKALNGVGGALAATYDNIDVPDVNISNATLQYNTATTHGGAIYLDAGTLDATDWWDFRWNTAGGNGGAVAVVSTGDADFSASGDRTSYLAVNHADGNGGALYVTNADTVQLHATLGQQLSLNTNSAGGAGGAVYANNGAFFDVYGQIQATSNHAGGDGGVFYLANGSRVWLDDYSSARPQILVNTADNGGAIYASDSPRVECDGVDFGSSNNGNSAAAGSGGAIYLSGSTFSAENCTFRNNQATVHGGAVAAYTSTLAIAANFAALATQLDRLDPTAPQATGCNPLVRQCSAFYGNLADSDLSGLGHGGALYLNGSQLALSDTYLHRNQAVRGGAIYQSGAGAVAEVQNTLIYSNTTTANYGAGIRTEAGVFTVTHVTLANGVNGAGYSQSGTTSFASNSIAWGNSANGFLGTFASAVCNIDQSSNAGLNEDPLFVAAGAGENYRLGSGSPAIDTCASGLPYDLDHVARPFGSQYDIGAYERHLHSVYLPLLMR